MQIEVDDLNVAMEGNIDDRLNLLESIGDADPVVKLTWAVINELTARVLALESQLNELRMQNPIPVASTVPQTPTVGLPPLSVHNCRPPPGRTQAPVYVN